MNPACTPLVHESTAASEDSSRVSAGEGSPRSAKSLKTLDIPRATMVIRSYSNKPVGGGGGANSIGTDSTNQNKTQRLRTKK